MKIAVSSTGTTLESTMDQRFGRAANFVVVDTETMDFESLNNGAAASGGGAGISAAQTVVDKGVGAIITGNIGPNAMNVLQAAQVDIFRGSPVSVKENIAKHQKGLLERIDTSVAAHSGMGR
ncbi:Dinitrogenase iron-molybdenum cofactor [Acididesulfobacillus acetoxydans]|uniref:Dinitrogenase iron-molybdenum cofactor n=1 Tax=Acididesulfobacillus acetoxydans TaxID=1561005 RepID=A0A8S0Y0M5_9FIRM|nr:NifB/NifX family molybdenum-iron cluster-binding protein [Acididesulfobacillus acetoxydans]CAA7603297.1 Dinitrogenase iron-molybdenum cofactor [Acididesulfobacillus acetoxydans]